MCDLVYFGFLVSGLNFKSGIWEEVLWECLVSFIVCLIMLLKIVIVFCGFNLGNDLRFEESVRGKVVLSNLM